MIAILTLTFHSLNTCSVQLSRVLTACCWIRVDKEIWFISLFKREMVPLSIRACSVMNTKFWAALWRVNRSDVAKHDSFWLDLLYCFDNDRPQPLVSLVLIIQCAPCQLWYHNFVYIQSFNVWNFFVDKIKGSNIFACCDEHLKNLSLYNSAR